MNNFVSQYTTLIASSKGPLCSGMWCCVYVMDTKAVIGACLTCHVLSKSKSNCKSSSLVQW